MNKWVEHCTRGRKDAKKNKDGIRYLGLVYINVNSCIFRDAMFKLIVNSTFGKTLQNVRTEKKYKMVSNMEELMKENSDPYTIR